MFSYCNNDPVNFVDPTGAASLWYYLIVDHDMGFIHRMVQLHIKSTHGSNIRTELVLPNFGRADIVNTSNGTVWEVKHAGQYPSLRALEALAQAKKYIGGSQYAITIIGLGNPGAFSGSFHIVCDKYYYEVSYKTPQAGVVLYTVKEVSNYQGQAEYAYYPKQSIAEERSRMPGLVGFGLIPSSGGTTRISKRIKISLFSMR